MRKKRLGSILISAALIVILAVFLINLKEGSSRAPADAVALSEIMISNKGSVPDNLGGYPDYIELHNGSTEKADISGYGLSDSLLEGVRTLTGNIVMEMGYAQGLHREALIATGVVLFVFILIINLLFSILKRKESKA